MSLEDAVQMDKPTVDTDVTVSKWHYGLLPGGIICSHRQRYLHASRFLIEDIILESRPIKLEDSGVEKSYPQLRRRK